LFCSTRLASIRFADGRRRDRNPLPVESPPTAVPGYPVPPLRTASLAAMSISSGAMAVTEGPPRAVAVAGRPAGFASFFFNGNVGGPAGACSYFMGWQGPFPPAGSAAYCPPLREIMVVRSLRLCLRSLRMTPRYVAGLLRRGARRLIHQRERGPMKQTNLSSAFGIFLAVMAAPVLGGCAATVSDTADVPVLVSDGEDAVASAREAVHSYGFGHSGSPGGYGHDHHAGSYAHGNGPGGCGCGDSPGGCSCGDSPGGCGCGNCPGGHGSGLGGHGNFKP
jgi:hypothetical protein